MCSVVADEIIKQALSEVLQRTHLHSRSSPVSRFESTEMLEIFERLAPRPEPEQFEGAVGEVNKGLYLEILEAGGMEALIKLSDVFGHPSALFGTKGDNLVRRRPENPRHLHLR